MRKRIPNIDEFINESKTEKFTPVFHGGQLDFSKPIYFNDKKIIAMSYGEVTCEYAVTLNKYVSIDFSSAEGWWLPEQNAVIQSKKLGMTIEDFDKYKEHKNIRDVKTDHFVRAALERGYDGIVFENIMDAGSLPIKGKYIRSTDIVVLYPNKINIAKL
jgi:hypothetical protein